MQLDARAIETTTLRHRPAPAGRMDFRIFIDEAVFDQIIARGNAELDREVGGVLVGEVRRDDAGPYIHIDASIDALHADEKAAELTFTHKTWDHINRELDDKHKNKTVVGWWHTHPGFGVFLSDRDQFIHQSFFNLPFQIAFVYDPRSKDHGTFTWQRGELRRARLYWVDGHPHSWDGDRSVSAPISDVAERSPNAAAPAEAPPRGADWLGIAAFAAILSVCGAVLWFWVLRRAPLEGPPTADRAAISSAADAIGELENELLRVWRATMDKEALDRQLGEAAALLASAETALNEDAEDALPRERLAAARDALDRTRKQYASASVFLRELERAASRKSRGERQLEQEMALYRTALGNLYLENAREAVAAGDSARARRLLAVATKIDPGNAARYREAGAAATGAGAIAKPSPRSEVR